jgi:hypothetical protein
MVIKIDRGDGTFHVFPEVKDVIYNTPETFIRGMMHETCPEYLDKVLGAPGSGECHNGISKPLAYYDVHPQDYPFEQKRIFLGKRREVEQYCMRKIVFIQHKIEYCFVTEFPVYLCSDTGKTIEVIK